MSTTAPPPRRARRWADHLAFLWTRGPLGILLVMTFLLGAFELSDFDIWYHLRAGEWIQQHGTVPEKDLFSFMSKDESWIDVHWGFQVVVATLYGAFGSAGLVLMKATLGASAVLIGLGAYRRQWPTTVQVLVWIPTVMLMSSRFYERPEMFTMVFTAIFLAVLFHAEEHPRWLWLLPLVQVLWANVQGLFVFGPILVGMYWAEAMLRLNLVRGLFRHLMPVTLLVVAACLASPYGRLNAVLVAQIAQTASSSLYRETIAELVSVPNLIEKGGMSSPYVWLLMGLLGLGGLSVVVGWRGILVEGRMFRVLPLIAFGYLGLQAVRNGNHFALVTGTVACWNFGSAGWRQRNPRWIVWLQLLVVLPAFWFVASNRWHLLIGSGREFGLGQRAHYYAHDAMRLAGRADMPKRAILYHNGHAAVYEYLNGPTRQPYMDARLEVHTPQTYKEFLELKKLIAAGPGAWERRVESLDAPLIGADSDTNPDVQAALLLHPSWSCVYFDEVYALFLRRDWSSQPPAIDLRQRLWHNPIAIETASLPHRKPPPPWWWLIPPSNVEMGVDDLLAKRLTEVGLFLAKHPESNAALTRTVFWWAARSAHRGAARRPWSPESDRRLGVAWYALAGQRAAGADPPALLSATTDWTPSRGLLAAAALAAFHRVIEHDPSDYVALYYAHLLLLTLQVDDAALDLVEQLSRLRPRNETQMKAVAPAIKETLPKLRDKVNAARQKLAAAGVHEQRGFTALDHYARDGLLATGLSRLEDRHRLKELKPERLDRLGTWFLLLGRPHGAAALYESAADTSFSASLRQERLGCCAFAAGNYPSARRAWLECVRLDSSNHEARYGLLLLAAIEGNRAAAEEQLAALRRLGELPAFAKEFVSTLPASE